MRNVVIADDHEIIRQGLKRILSQNDRYTVKAEAGTIPELKTLLSSTGKTDALILDLSIPGGGGLEALKDIRNGYPDLPVLIFSMHPESLFALRAFKAGASGYLSKECAPERLLQALHAITSGQRFFTKTTDDLIREELKEKSSCERLPHLELSDRELAVFTSLGQGKTLTLIAKDFSLSISTISTYRQRVLKKMKMRTNSQMVGYVVMHDLAPSV
jgi:two-component system invasion response regulator UvrY